MKKAQLSPVWIFAILLTIIMTMATFRAINNSDTEESKSRMQVYVIMSLLIALFAVIGFAYGGIPGAMIGVIAGWAIGTLLIKWFVAIAFIKAVGA